MVQQVDKKPLFLFIGKSASGKTTIANMLEAEGYTQIASYTTRSPRYEGEKEHIFISEEEYNSLQNIVASTTYNSHHYCTTLEQIQNADIYVVDIQGVETLLDNYELIGRKIYVIYFDANIYNRIQRMINRGDSDSQIVSRLLNDEKYNWVERLWAIEDVFSKISIRYIDANQDLQQVYLKVKNIIQETQLS